MGEEPKVDKTIDIKGQACPYTFVRSKLAIEKMNVGEVLEILLDHRPAVDNVPKSMEGEGQKVLSVEKINETDWRILVKKETEKKK